MGVHRMSLELAIALATVAAMTALILVAIVGRLNALDDDNPSTIIIPPLVKDEDNG